MHRSTAPFKVSLLALLALLAGCEGLFVPETPRFSAEAVGGMLKLSGRASLATIGSGGLQRNAPVDLDSGLNLSDREFAIGGRIAYTDGFQGAELNFLRFEEKSFKTSGTLDHDFGDLPRDDNVRSEALLNQWRLAYVGKVLDTKIDKVGFRVGAGLGLHHNDLGIETVSVNTPQRQERLKIRDNGLPMLLLRTAFDYGPVTVQLDGGWMEGDFGDIDGTVLDLALAVQYKLQRGVFAWVGYRRYDMPASGFDDFRPYDFDIDLQGYTFGLRLTF